MNGKPKSFWMTTKGVAVLSLIGAATYFLMTKHSEHIIIFLPYLIFLACPLMHMFMHRNHGRGHHAEHHEQDKPGNEIGQPKLSKDKQSPHNYVHPRGSS